MPFAFAPLRPRSYDFAMIDFSWPWETWSEKGAKKSPSAHYKPQTWEEIEQSEPEKLLKPGGVIWFWCTWSLIARQTNTIENVFGLEIKTGGAWRKMTRNGKPRMGPGKILRNCCDPFVIACSPKHKLKARGAARNFIETVADLELDGVARQHSRKPEEAYELVERLTPGWRRADVYTRTVREGWDGFGDEMNKFKTAA